MLLYNSFEYLRLIFSFQLLSLLSITPFTAEVSKKNLLGIIAIEEINSNRTTSEDEFDAYLSFVRLSDAYT